MPDKSFDTLRSELSESGIPAGHVSRILLELEDHVEDLRSEALNQGRSESEAAKFATRRIGDQRLIAKRMLEHTEFKSWVYRYPRIGRIYLPVAYALLLPVAPIFAGLANPTSVFRWGASLMLGAGITAMMFLSMQLAIVVG